MMTRRLLLLLLLPLLPLKGNVNFPVEENVTQGFMIEEDKTPYPPAYSFSGVYVNVAKTHFRTPEVKEQDLTYRELDLNGTYTIPCSEYSGFAVGAGYIGSSLIWKENPDFDREHFQYVVASLSGYTAAITDWVWKAGLNLLIDTQELSLSDYTLYQGYLFGKYTLAEPLLFTAGFLLEVGLHKEKIWPVLGFEYFPFEALDIHLVYPLDVSINYHPIPQISIGASARFLRNRHRVKNDETLPMGIFEYHTNGAEVDLTYLPFDFLNLKAFAGSTFNGDLKITDRNNHNATHFKFKGSFYAGGSANLIF